MSTLSIQIDPPHDHRQCVNLSGRLDTHTYEALDEALSPLLATPITLLVLDMTGLDYISSAGIRSIFKVRKALATRDGRVLVTHPQPQIRKVFDMVKAVPLGEIFTSAQELDAYLDTMQHRTAAASGHGTPAV